MLTINVCWRPLISTLAVDGSHGEYECDDDARGHLEARATLVAIAWICKYMSVRGNHYINNRISI